MILCTVLYCDVHTASDASSSKMLETQDLRELQTGARPTTCFLFFSTCLTSCWYSAWPLLRFFELYPSSQQARYRR